MAVVRFIVLPGHRHEIPSREAFRNAVLAFALMLPVVSLDPRPDADLMRRMAESVPIAASLVLLRWIRCGRSVFFRTCARPGNALEGSRRRPSGAEATA